MWGCDGASPKWCRLLCVEQRDRSRRQSAAPSIAEQLWSRRMRRRRSRSRRFASRRGARPRRWRSTVRPTSGLCIPSRCMSCYSVRERMLAPHGAGRWGGGDYRGGATRLSTRRGRECVDQWACRRLETELGRDAATPTSGSTVSHGSPSLRACGASIRVVVSSLLVESGIGGTVEGAGQSDRHSCPGTARNRNQESSCGLHFI